MNLSEGRTNISHLQTGSDVGNTHATQGTYFNLQNKEKYKSLQGSHDFTFQFGWSKHLKEHHSNDFSSPTFVPNLTSVSLLTPDSTILQHHATRDPIQEFEPYPQKEGVEPSQPYIR